MSAASTSVIVDGAHTPVGRLMGSLSGLAGLGGVLPPNIPLSRNGSTFYRDPDSRSTFFNICSQIASRRMDSAWMRSVPQDRKKSIILG